MAMPIEYLENEIQPRSVNGFNLNNQSTIILDSTIDVSKKYSEGLTENFDKYNLKDIQIKPKIESYLNCLYEYIDLLYHIKFLNDEFHKGCSIKNIASYILKDNELFITHISFLLELIESFIILCRYKIENRVELVKNKPQSTKEYNKLSNYFRKKERFFYTDIYNSSEKYDEKSLDEMTNLLVR